MAYQVGGISILKNINVEFPEGAITSVIGKSGSGKSTLLKLMLGLAKPTAGEVVVGGRVVDANRDMIEMRKNLGYVVQHTGLFPHADVFDNLTMQGRVHHHSKAAREQRADELMQMLQLPNSYKHKFPHQLSGGEQQRVGIGRALYLNPPLLLMDEPFGALDPLTRSELQDQVLALQRHEPKTIVLVTHDMREAMLLSQFMVVLDRGEVVQMGGPDVIKQAPASKLVAQMLATAR